MNLPVFLPVYFFWGLGFGFLFFGVFIGVFFSLLISVELCSDHTYFSKFFCNRILYFQFVPKLCESYLDQKVPRLMGSRWAAPGILRGRRRSPPGGPGASWRRAGRRRAGGRPTAGRQDICEGQERPALPPRRLAGVRTLDCTS